MIFKSAKFAVTYIESNRSPREQTYIMILEGRGGKRKNKRQVNKIDLR